MKRKFNLTDNFTASSSFIQAVIHSYTSNIIIKELTEWDKGHIWLSRWHLPKGSTNITCPSVCCAHERTYSPELRSLKESSFKNEKKASAKIKAMKWHCSHQEWDEEKEGDWGPAQWVWVQLTSHFKVKSKSISGDIQLVKALEGRVGNLIHLAKHHPRQLCVLWHPAFEVTGNQDEGQTCGDLWVF